MSPTSPKVKDVFDQAVEIDAPLEREAFVARVCAGNSELRQEVDALLRAYIEGVAAMNRDRETALRVLAKYLKRNDPSFLEEMYKIAVQFTDRIPRVDAARRRAMTAP